MTDEFDEREWSDVHAAYSRLPKREPSAALDAAVLAAAREAVSQRAGRSGGLAHRPRWLVPVGAAAALVLAVGIGFRLQKHAEEPWSEVASRAPAPVAPAAPKPQDADKTVVAQEPAGTGGPAASNAAAPAEAPAPLAKSAEKQDLARAEPEAFPSGKDQPAPPPPSQPAVAADTRTPAGRADEYRRQESAQPPVAAAEPPVVAAESAPMARPAPAPAAAAPPPAPAKAAPATRDDGLVAGRAKPKTEQKSAASGGEQLEPIESAGSRAKREDVELERKAVKEEAPSAPATTLAAPTTITDRDRERPRTWAAAIARELDAGHRDVALRETRALHERFPRYELPPRLAELLR